MFELCVSIYMYGSLRILLEKSSTRYITEGCACACDSINAYMDMDMDIVARGRKMSKRRVGGCIGRIVHNNENPFVAALPLMGTGPMRSVDGCQQKHVCILTIETATQDIWK